MSHRERNVRIFRREPVDGVLWQPRIEHWYHVNRDQGTLPERYEGLSLLEVFDDLGCSVRPYWAFNPCQHFEDVQEVPREEMVEGPFTTITLHTPKGDLVTILERTSIAHHTRKYPVVTPDDMRAMEWVLRNRRAWFDLEEYARACARIGDRAAPSIYVPRINVLRVMIEFMGFEHGTTALYLHPREMEHFIQTINETDAAMLEMVAGSPIEIVNFGDNVHQALCAPPIFERYVMPEYVRRNEILHRAGKKTYPHWDGDCGQLLRYARDCGFDGFEAITPVPQGDVTLEQVRDALGDRILLDGIPCTDFLPEEPIEGLIANARTCIEYFHPHLVLGISDEISPVGDIERVRLVSAICAEYASGTTSESLSAYAG